LEPQVAYTFDVLTLFPPLFDGLRQESLLGKAMTAGTLQLQCHDWRQFATDRHSTVDDHAFGGGPGLVLRPDVLAACLDDLRPQRPPHTRTVLLSPAGQPFTQARAVAYAQLPGLILLCGRYEGFDARIEHLVDDVVSIGDYVLNGGEVAAMAIIEATARLVPGVIGNAESLVQESHELGGLEYPQYTKPRQFRDMAVPAALLSGHHAQIETWRRRQSLLRTRDRRPELLDRTAIGKKDLAWLDAQPAGSGLLPPFDPPAEG
jgi:tRNA (guanine37-N1)-methyltransferase